MKNRPCNHHHCDTRIYHIYGSRKEPVLFVTRLRLERRSLGFRRMPFLKKAGRAAAAEQALAPTVEVTLPGSSGTPQRMCPWGDIRPFENEVFEGQVFFAHRPPAGSGPTFDHGALLEGRGDPIPLWELQIQGRFKVQPVGSVFFAAELWDHPMQLNFLTRAACMVVLGIVAALAKQRGFELRYSFGSASGEKPAMGFPLMGADRIFITEEPVALPIPGDNRKGVFSIDASGTVQQLDRSGRRSSH